MAERTRFAPSPTGFLHLGHAHAALFAWSRARAGAGRFLVRIEDIDTSRCRPEYAAAALADLAWLGLEADEPVRLQSAHLDEYAGLLATLGERGLVYPCFCTRSAIRHEVASMAAAPHDPDGAPLYPGTCRALGERARAARIATGQPFALRLDMAAALAERVRPPLRYETEEGERVPCDPSRFGDVVLGRKDAPASYHLAVTHDDAASGITLVTRGEDLAPVTGVHRLLQDLFDWPAPRYAFHTLLRDAHGRRLAKRDGARSIGSMREDGLSPDEVKMLAGFPPGSTPAGT